jgi:hypothetical protein
MVIWTVWTVDYNLRIITAKNNMVFQHKEQYGISAQRTIWTIDCIYKFKQRYWTTGNTLVSFTK